MRGGGSVVFGSGTSSTSFDDHADSNRAVSPPPCSCRAQPGSSCTRRRCRAAGSATRRTASSTGSRRPGSRGGRCCRSGRRTSSARRTATASAFAGSPALLADPQAPVSADELEDFVARHAVLERRAGRASRARARSPTRCASSASGRALRAYARERGVRLIGDVPIYVSDAGADVDGVAGALRARRGRRRAAGRAERERAALGQPALRLARAPRDRLPLVDRALPARVRARRRLARSTTSAASSRTGRSRRGTRPRATARWRRGPGAELFRAVEGAARRAAADRRGPRRDHAAGLPAARRARPAGHGRPALGVRRAAGEPARACEPPREPGRLHEHARHRHGRRLVRRR